MFGLLNIDKPSGLTSRDVVNRVQRLTRPLKVGHAGTLDPLAIGVLIIAVGQATRLIEYIQRMRKRYLATFLLGRTSDTDDIDGHIVELRDAPTPTEEQVRIALSLFVGTIEQRPPDFSAVKISGQRAYKLARRGTAVEIAPRPVEVHAIELVGYVYPELTLLIECGSGTYVRSLGRDLAAALGSGAVMSALRRLAIGPFKADEGVKIDQLTLDIIKERLLPPALALGPMPQIVIDHDDATRLVRGQTIVNRFSAAADEVAAIGSDGRLMAILAPVGRLELRPTKCFAPIPD